MTGIGSYTADLVASTIQYGGPHSYVYLTNGSGPKLPLEGRPNLQQWRVEVKHPLWEQLHLPTELSDRGVDVYHSPLFTCPIVKQVPSVITLHDAIPETHPELCSQEFLSFYRARIGPSVRAAERIVTTSQFAKGEILKHLKAPSEKVDVIYQGIGGGFAPKSRARLPELREKLHLPERYALFVGMLDARKNVARLILAFGLAAKDVADLYLVIVGRKDDPSFSLEEPMRHCGVAERIIQLGYVASEDLPGLYAGAEVFVFPSLSEGFGRPVVEAMASGAPVVTSDRSSLPEIAGDAALLVDPTDTSAMADGILRVCKDAELRKRCVEKGLARAAEFTDEKFGGRLVEFYNSIERKE
jgi:glycosyltransferase involved in cell wall biosynthesis